MDEKELAAVLLKDLDEIAAHLVSAFGLRHAGSAGDPSTALFRWLDFRLRYIEPIPRRFAVSDRFPKFGLPASAVDGLHHLEQLILNGDDINPYQGRGLIQLDDTSGAKRQRRTDHLWADWGVHHLHLTALPPVTGDYCAPRSGWLLFCINAGDEVGFIDIRDHNEPDLFANLELIETIARSWPDLMERHRVKHVLPGRGNPTAHETVQLRRAGVTTFVTLNGNIYAAPGGGVTSAATATRTSMIAIRMRKCVRHLAKLALDPIGQMQASLKAVGNPNFHLPLTAKGVALHERRSNTAWMFDREPDTDAPSLYDLTQWMTPAWVLKASAYVVLTAPATGSP
jgi:hypothetical protein